MGGPSGKRPPGRRIPRPGTPTKLRKVQWREAPAGNADLHSWPKSREQHEGRPEQTVLDTARGRMISALDAAREGRKVVGGITVVQSPDGTFYRFEVVAGGHIVCTGIGRYANNAGSANSR